MAWLYLMMATKNGPPRALPSVVQTRKWRKAPTRHALSGEQAGQHLDASDDHVVKVGVADHRGDHPGEYDLTDRIPRRGHEPGYQPHQPAGQEAAQQDDVPGMLGHGSGNFAKDAAIDDPESRSDQDSEPGEGGRTDEVGGVDHNPGPGQLGDGRLAVQDRQDRQGGLLGEQLRAADHHENETHGVHVRYQHLDDGRRQRALDLGPHDGHEEEAEADIEARRNAGKEQTKDRTPDGNPALRDFMPQDLFGPLLGVPLVRLFVLKVGAHARAPIRAAGSRGIKAAGLPAVPLEGKRYTRRVPYAGCIS